MQLDNGILNVKGNCDKIEFYLRSRLPDWCCREPSTIINIDTTPTGNFNFWVELGPELKPIRARIESKRFSQPGEYYSGKRHFDSIAFGFSEAMNLQEYMN